MDDLINRQAVLDFIQMLPIDLGRREVEEIRAHIREMPEIEPERRWIPVTERLPEDAYPVIITWTNEDPASYYQYILGKHYVGVAHYKNSKWFWYSSTTEDVLMEYGKCDYEEFDEAIKVVAWMPLPEPYSRKEGDRNDNN